MGLKSLSSLNFSGSLNLQSCNWFNYVVHHSLDFFVFAGFCLFYAVHGVLREREFELYAYIMGILVLLAYISIDLIVNHDHKSISNLKWVSPMHYELKMN